MRTALPCVTSPRRQRHSTLVRRRQPCPQTANLVVPSWKGNLDYCFGAEVANVLSCRRSGDRSCRAVRHVAPYRRRLVHGPGEVVDPEGVGDVGHVFGEVDSGWVVQVGADLGVCGAFEDGPEEVVVAVSG